jgi:hypothetical protein
VEKYSLWITSAADRRDGDQLSVVSGAADQTTRNPRVEKNLKYFLKLLWNNNLIIIS